MSYVYFFRGKAATGKTTITNILSNQLKVAVLRKDDIFDSLSTYIEDNSVNSNAAYDILARLIQTNIDNQSDVIVDVGLFFTTGFKQFISKLDLRSNNFIIFHCDCTDVDIWKNRFQERLINPTPNQYFSNVDEIINYYSNSKIELLENEYVIDSAKNLGEIMENIYSIIRKTTI
ncbi:MAG: AAA family ATPase [Ruminiclostridium sp.]